MYCHDLQSLLDSFQALKPVWIKFKDYSEIKGFICSIDLPKDRFAVVGMNADPDFEDIHRDLVISEVIEVDDLPYPIEPGGKYIIYVDDLRTGDPEKKNQIIVKSVGEAKALFKKIDQIGAEIECVDLDHDLGSYEPFGGDAIKLMEYMLEENCLYPVKIHTANSSAADAMEQLRDRYWPK